MFNKVIIVIIFFTLFAYEANSQALACRPGETLAGQLCLERRKENLVGTDIPINVYTRRVKGKNIDRTFVVVHANEEKGLDAAKKVISKNYGRLVEVVSNAPNGKSRRHLYFGANLENSVDPNRIYTVPGIKKNHSNNVKEITSFGQKLLSIVTNNFTHRLIIGVHNNTPESLSLGDWSYEKDCDLDEPNKQICEDAFTSAGIFKANNHSRKEMVDTDDFILVSNVKLFALISSLEEPFNIALQKNRRFLVESEGVNKGKVKEELDDGSMSLYFGSTFVKGTSTTYDYINVEAEGKENIDDARKAKQMKAIELIITKIRV